MTEKELLELVRNWDNFQITLKNFVENPDQIPVLIKVAVYSSDLVSWRALWMVDKIYDIDATLIAPFLPEMIQQLKVETHHGKKRHLLKLISQMNIPENQAGFLMDYCLTTFTSDKEPVANRVHAMQVLFNISESEPELKPELLEIIQQEIDFHPTPGIRSRGSKLVKKLQQQINA
jgi:hypothetical protein